MAPDLGPPHPLAPLSADEVRIAQRAVLASHPASDSLYFRSIHRREPEKALLVRFLEAEHAGSLDGRTHRPPRLASVEYTALSGTRHKHTSSVVDISSAKVVSEVVAPPDVQPYYVPDEFISFEPIALQSKLFRDAMTEFILPDGFELVLDAWPFGGWSEDDGPADELPRYMTGLVFARPRGSADHNHYAYPVPLTVVMDWKDKTIVRVDRLPTGGAGDGLCGPPRAPEPRKLFESSLHAEYLPELLDIPLRTDLKPIHITQPEGASFRVHADGLVEWQKWRFRLGITPREGAVLHDVRYDGRPVLYRLSFSEMTVPYADPRPPFQHKQAFDFGDGGIGRCCNSLQLGCDCLGAIHYVDALGVLPDGSPSPYKSIVCVHEQDNGLLWKHTNYRTGRAAAVRNREFVVQFIATLANYEYVFSYKLDLAGAITMETRATGIVSIVPIDEGKTSRFGNIVSPGILAQNHQHIFAVRIDPAIDSYREGDTRVVVEESVGRKMDPATNPYGNLYEVERKPVPSPTWIDAEPRRNRLLKLEHTSRKNAHSGRSLAYKLLLPATQLLLADGDGLAARRARFAQHHLWVTGYRDGEFYAAGEYTNQSGRERGGVSDMVKRQERFAVDAAQVDGDGEGDRSSPVVWAVFGLTHNPRVEDWPVMPMESLQVHLKPNDFFNFNPALDVPPARRGASVLVPCCERTLDAAGGGSEHA